MKRVGTTIDGSALVEVTNDEFTKLTMIAEIVSGKTFNSPLHTYTINVDLDEALNAMLQWTIAREKANALRALADQIDETLRLKVNHAPSSDAGSAAETAPAVDPEPDRAASNQ